MGNIKSFVFVAAIGYGLYAYCCKGDFTVIPPSEKAVVQAVATDKMQRFKNYDVALHGSCLRVGGGMVRGGVFDCKIETSHKQGNTQVRIERVTLVKRKNCWVLL